MESFSNNLIILRSLTKLYDQYLDEVRKKYNLTQIEITIIGFLHNNPLHDTATDIAEMRMLQKGNVSQGVEQLIQKSLLIRTPDTKDRRRVHLSLTGCADSIVADIANQNERLSSLVYSNLSRKEMQLYEDLSQRLKNSILSGLEKGDTTNE